MKEKQRSNALGNGCQHPCVYCDNLVLVPGSPLLRQGNPKAERCPQCMSPIEKD